MRIQSLFLGLKVAKMFRLEFSLFSCRDACEISSLSLDDRLIICKNWAKAHVNTPIDFTYNLTQLRKWSLNNKTYLIFGKCVSLSKWAQASTNTGHRAMTSVYMYLRSTGMREMSARHLIGRITSRDSRPFIDWCISLLENLLFL